MTSTNISVDHTGQYVPYTYTPATSPTVITVRLVPIDTPPTTGVDHVTG